MWQLLFSHDDVMHMIFIFDKDYQYVDAEDEGLASCWLHNELL